MSSHVVVLDPSARRAVIKTNPGKHMTEVLQEACTKLGLDFSHHGLKSNNKAIDLSQPFRLSGLSSGAKLQLVLLSRSPSAVSVALQLPESEGQSPSRLTGKFPSTMTIWLLLRSFESTSEPSMPPRNFTARALPRIQSGNGGSDRLFYETPVIQVMGRELASFADLQKTLAQLGFNGGSVLLRLSFRLTHTTFDDATSEIDHYFQSNAGENTDEAHTAGEEKLQSIAAFVESIPDQEPYSTPPQAETSMTQQPAPTSSTQDEPSTGPEAGDKAPDLDSSPEPKMSGYSQRAITVFAPPSTKIPAAALEPHNEKDYEPTIDQAKIHQSRLASSGRNKAMPSDAQLAVQAKAQAKKQAEIRSVNIKIRFPDQSAVIAQFSKWETGEHLYNHVREMLEYEGEPFSLIFSTAKGPRNIPKDSTQTLITDLGMVGNVLVNFLWEAGSSNKARNGMLLKHSFRQKALEIEVKDPEGIDVVEKAEVNGQGKGTEKREGGNNRGIPKWLKLPGKK